MSAEQNSPFFIVIYFWHWPASILDRKERSANQDRVKFCGVQSCCSSRMIVAGPKHVVQRWRLQSELGLRSSAQGTGSTRCLFASRSRADGGLTEQQSNPRARGVRRSSKCSVKDKNKPQWKDNNKKGGVKGMACDIGAMRGNQY